ncbi:MAG: N-acetyltransferase [Alphaproteobacteria bacterium]|nr:N-acetyltransferase [Alphaproteobacteria bacterium]
MNPPTIRPARASDLPALLDIYNHYILTTPVTFDIEPRTLAQRQEWFAQFSQTGRYRCFVAEEAGQAVGWACSARFKDKQAYETTIESSIYLAPAAAGRGLGRRLYETLFEALRGEDIHRVFAGVTVPNDASVALHRAMGFELVGTYSEVGRKFGRFWDTALFMRDFEREFAAQ